MGSNSTNLKNQPSRKRGQESAPLLKKHARGSSQGSRMDSEAFQRGDFEEDQFFDDMEDVTENSVEDEDFEHEGGGNNDVHRRRTLERNRVAATKCRRRKRGEASELASRGRVMEEQHRHLSSCFNYLSEEVHNLKSQLLLHTNCNCELIQRYIAGEARKSVDGTFIASSSSKTQGNPTFADNMGSCGDIHGSSQSIPRSNDEYMTIPYTNAFEQPVATTMLQNDLSRMDPLTMEAVPEVPGASSSSFFAQQMPEENSFSGFMDEDYICDLN